MNVEGKWEIATLIKISFFGIVIQKNFMGEFVKKELKKSYRL